MMVITEPKERVQKNDSIPKAQIPSGPACAAVLAPSIGVAVYGMAVVAATMRPAIADFLTWSKGVGPLSGKTSVGVIAWLIAQVILCGLWHNREVNFRRVWMVACVLIALGFAFTFPPVYDAFAPK
jgi:hypothetical protein